MGFLDKAKATATAAVAQGQAKVGAMQQSRSEHELYKSLGEATYRAQRQGGDPAAVDAALTALDAHFAQVAEAAAAQAAQAAAQPAPPSAAPSASNPAAAPPSGNFTLDDM
jgi:hypothetical protein